MIDKIGDIKNIYDMSDEEQRDVDAVVKDIVNEISNSGLSVSVNDGINTKSSIGG